MSRVPDNRSLSTKEREFLAWLLQHGAPSAHEYCSQIDTARVVARCSCGCASIDFLEAPAAPLETLSDHQWRDGDGHLFGVFAFAKEGRLAGIEEWSIDGQATPTSLGEWICLGGGRRSTQLTRDSLDADPPSARAKHWCGHLSPSRSEYRKQSCGTSMRRCEGMGQLVFGMMQSLDGYVDGVAGPLAFPPPGIALGRHFNDHVRGLAGCLYGRRIYEIMRYWDEDRPEWDAADRDFAAAWRAQPKWACVPA